MWAFVDAVLKHGQWLQSVGQDNAPTHSVPLVVHRQHSPPSPQCSRWWCTFSSDARPVQGCSSLQPNLLDASQLTSFLPSEVLTQVDVELASRVDRLEAQWLSEMFILCIRGLEVAGSATQSCEWDAGAEGSTLSSSPPATVSLSLSPCTSMLAVTAVAAAELFLLALIVLGWRIQYGKTRCGFDEAEPVVKGRRHFEFLAAVKLRVTRLQQTTLSTANDV